MNNTAQKETGHTVNYWIHRISHEWDVSYKLLKEGYLSIGWGAMAGSGVEQRVFPGGDSAPFEEALQAEGYSLGRSRWCLWNFCCFRPGDIVVVPLMNGAFSIYQIAGTPVPIYQMGGGKTEFTTENGSKICRDSGGMLRRAAGERVDLGFVVLVHPLKEWLSRYEYADQKLTARMKIRQTNAGINDLAESVEKVLQAEAPLNLYASVIEELAQKLLEAIKQQLNPEKFELLVKWYFERLGASETDRPGKNNPDKGEGADADVIASFDPLKIIFYVQIKLHDEVSSRWAVEQIARYRDLHEPLSGEYTVIPWALSTAERFSPEAVVLAQQNHVRLITGPEFARMLIDAGITDINKAFD